MVSHNFTCSPTRASTPRLNPNRWRPVLDLPTPEGWKAELPNLTYRCLITPGPGIEPMTVGSEVRRRTAAPPRHPLTCVYQHVTCHCRWCLSLWLSSFYYVSFHRRSHTSTSSTLTSRTPSTPEYVASCLCDNECKQSLTVLSERHQNWCSNCIKSNDHLILCYRRHNRQVNYFQPHNLPFVVRRLYERELMSAKCGIVGIILKVGFVASHRVKVVLLTADFQADDSVQVSEPQALVSNN